MTDISDAADALVAYLTEDRAYMETCRTDSLSGGSSFWLDRHLNLYRTGEHYYFALSSGEVTGGQADRKTPGVIRLPHWYD